LFGDRLRHLRKSQGLTQDDLAIAINVSRQSIGNYENYSVYPDLDTLVLISDFFNVSADYMLCRTNEMYNLNLAAKDNRELLLKIYEIIDLYKILKK